MTEPSRIRLTRPEGAQAEDFAPTRRALGALVLAGYALGAGPGRAEVIVTDAEGLETAEVMIPGRDTALPAYIARPAARGRHPVVIVVSEVFGVHEYIRDVCRRLAKAGYVALAPAFFHRVGDPAGLTDFAQIQAIVETAADAQVMGDIEASLDWLRGQAFADRSRIAVTGFCWGGAVTWMAAARLKPIKAGVAWYGRLARPAAGTFLGDEARLWPMDVADRLTAPVLGLYAEQDRGIPLSDVEAMRALLAANGGESAIVVYPGAQHGFHADYRAAYDPAAAADGWARMLAHFAAHGVRPRR